MKEIENENGICTDIGIYTDVHPSGNKARDRHKLYYAKCKVCGTVVEKILSDIKRSNKICRHRVLGKNKILNKTSDDYKFNDMPKGWINQSELNKRIYSAWKAMINRTTKKFWEKYPSYTGTTVDDNWRTLSNFVNDIKELEGYNEWSLPTGRGMMLDKDTIVEGNKHYSKETCRFITHAESNRDVHKRHPESLLKARNAFIEKNSKPVKFTNIKTNETIEFSSLKEGCRELNLNFGNAWMVLNEDYTSHHTIGGWTITETHKAVI